MFAGGHEEGLDGAHKVFRPSRRGVQLVECVASRSSGAQSQVRALRKQLTAALVLVSWTVPACQPITQGAAPEALQGRCLAPLRAAGVCEVAGNILYTCISTAKSSSRQHTPLVESGGQNT